jgi:hypothetical protein
MNFQGNGAPGGALSFGQLWHPPISLPWMVSIAILLVSVNLDALSPTFLRLVQSPLGFFLGLLVALGIYQVGFPPGCFAVLFFLLMVWIRRNKHMEGFHPYGPYGNVDWVTNNKRWFVEKVLKEKPAGIQEKDVATYPIQGDSSLPSY